MADESYESDTDDRRAAPRPAGPIPSDDSFSLFEPPPEIDPNKFGPVPVVSAESPPIDPLVLGGLGGDEVVDLTVTDLTVTDRASREKGLSTSDWIAGITAPDLATADLGARSANESGDTGLPHWTEPATGQVPKVVSSGENDWSELAGPRWKGEGPDWADDDLAGVFGTSTAGPGPSQLPDEPLVIDDTDDELNGLLPPGAGAPQRPAIRPRPRVEAPVVERNIPQAIMMGIVLAAVALLAFRLGDWYALGLITLAAALASVELFDTMRRAGVHPATLLGVVASVAFPLAVHARGEAAFPLVLGLLVVFGALWYLSGADTHRPALNLGLTFLGVCWIGGMAAFGSLLLGLPDGRSTIVAAIVVAVASDTGALAGGKAFGRRPFHPASPSKTWEGTLVGFVAAVVAGLVMGVYGISPFSENLVHAALLGVVAGILSPLGDLAESMVKRDLGVKDMGRLLPGHGGVLDRVDGLLFVLPGVYYLTLVLGLDQAVTAVVGQ